MSPEALARLREDLVRPVHFRSGPTRTVVKQDDLRALLEAYDTARAEGVAAERARVVADLRRQAKNWERTADAAEDKLANEVAEAVSIYLNRNADRFERGEHDKEGER